MLNKGNEAELASNRLEEILEAIEAQDTTAIKDMFSEQAQSDAVDLDGGINYLFALMDGNVESWEEIGSSVDEHNSHGQVTTKSRYLFHVNTDKAQYLFSILEYVRDADNSKNVGLYSIIAVNALEEEPLFSDAGIYKPEE